MNDVQASSLPERDHDHAICLNGALWRAKARCSALGIKWTSLRDKVFRQIATNHKPVSAYDLIESLAREGKRLAPVSIYRILDVFREAGLVHRLESRNAFFACMTEHESARQTITFICTNCDCVSELIAPGAYIAIGDAVEAARFSLTKAVIEVTGFCGDCQKIRVARC